MVRKFNSPFYSRQILFFSHTHIQPFEYLDSMKPYLILGLFVLQTTVIHAQHRYDIIIDEIMADPTPVVGLPNNEWIELKNRSALPVRLQNWRIADAASRSGPLPDIVLKPDSVIIVCAGSAVAALSIFGTAVPVSNFPSLDNDDDLLSLESADGNIIHAIHYSSSWYGNELKKNGGWSLEMIDPNAPCAGSSNWTASDQANGGTPGAVNSANAINSTISLPQLKRSYTADSLTVILVFDAPVDSSSSSIISNYAIDNGIIIDSSAAISPLFNEVRLKLGSALQKEMVYTITATNIHDCNNNTASTDKPVKTGIASQINRGDIIINEILFNPVPGAFDYVEFYNKSNKIIDASALYIANRNSSNTISSITQFTGSPFLLFPGEYLVITEDRTDLALHYFIKDPDAVMGISTLPSFPDDKGYIILLDNHGNIIDETDYLDDWHFALVNNAEGISLERIDPDDSSSRPGNWHSAASTAGYGTPGYKNSQYRMQQPFTASITVSPPVFSPDNDGTDDIASIRYKLDAAGYAANVFIYDAAGRIIRNLAHNNILGNSGIWNWNGLGEKNQSLPAGPYIVLTEIFNMEGKKRLFKNVVVLARKMN